ncbi:CoA-binding protein [Aeromicrobium sp. UC242_57]|uniref:CoA-binding protein n=1 Tax=Aeromicrobium sp. UC242_57 TaxID=3374624 RepID=UPI003793DFE4
MSYSVRRSSRRVRRCVSAQPVSPRREDEVWTSRPLLNPSTIALIGASDDKSRLGGLVLNNLLKEFEGAITPVNPNRSEVQGVPAVSSIASIDYVPDLAVIASPAKTVVPAVQDCIERGVKGLIVISSGFAETGEEGRVLQDELVRMTTAAGVPMVGPDCVGVISLPSKMRASFVRLMGIPMRAGATAVVSQSGAVGLSLFEQAQLCGVGSSYLATTGNEAGVTCAQLIEHVIDDDDVNVVLAYLEGIRDPDRLLAAGLRSAELGKPIVALKVGSSVSGGKAAVSHTGAMAVPDAMVDALLDRAGIIRVHSIRQMMDYAKAFAPGTRIGGKKTVILTGSGGTGVMMADAAESAGLDLAAPSPVLRPTLERLVPAIGSIANPHRPHRTDHQRAGELRSSGPCGHGRARVRRCRHGQRLPCPGN